MYSKIELCELNRKDAFIRTYKELFFSGNISRNIQCNLVTSELKQAVSRTHMTGCLGSATGSVFNCLACGRSGVRIPGAMTVTLTKAFTVNIAVSRGTMSNIQPTNQPTDSGKQWLERPKFEG